MFCDIPSESKYYKILLFAGNVQGNTPIIHGELNRTNKTWNFEASNGTKFQAKLFNGNMVI